MIKEFKERKTKSDEGIKIHKKTHTEIRLDEKLLKKCDM